MTRPIRALFFASLLALTAAAPAAQERRQSAIRSAVSPSVGASSSHGARASYRGTSRGTQRALRGTHCAQRVYVPGRWVREWIAPVYRTLRRPCGTLVQVLVEAGRYERRWQAGYYVLRG